MTATRDLVRRACDAAEQAKESRLELARIACMRHREPFEALLLRKLELRTRRYKAANSHARAMCTIYACVTQCFSSGVGP
jgi:hypothetical protein